MEAREGKPKPQCKGGIPRSGEAPFVKIGVLENFWDSELSFLPLRGSPCALKTEFFAFFHARIAGQESGAL